MASRTLCLVFLVSLTCLVLPAQTFTEGTADVWPPIVSAQESTGPPKPAALIHSLSQALEGTWSTEETYEPVFLTPQGGTGTGHQVFRPGPGGYTLLEEYQSKTPAGDLFGFGVIWWDESKGLQHLWCINVYPDGCEMFPPSSQPGPTWDGKQLVLHVESEQNGKRLIWHEVISNITANSFTQTAYVGESKDRQKLWFTIHSKRITDPVRH